MWRVGERARWGRSHHVPVRARQRVFKSPAPRRTFSSIAAAPSIAASACVSLPAPRAPVLVPRAGSAPAAAAAALVLLRDDSMRCSMDGRFCGNAGAPSNPAMADTLNEGGERRTRIPVKKEGRRQEKKGW